ncbi:hypothetical protein DPEC_G00214930 [Dallia pectoralis]|uniref:Uncharacterized protein n=1 Tax=Dallia pectoralis TaxID=75939 RepID=A0ACC2G281_DALPE|nr:hypothetical protein DPEC_G00214930 [Dallia pectoralis]
MWTSTLGKASEQVALDWISCKNINAVKVANQKKAFRLHTITKALSSIESCHRSCWLHEEKKVKRTLMRLAGVSPFRSQTLFQRPGVDSRTGFEGVDSRIQLPVAHQFQTSGEDNSSCASRHPPPRTPQGTADPSPRPSHRALSQHPLIRNTPLWSRDTSSEALSPSWRGLRHGGLSSRPIGYSNSVNLAPQGSSSMPLPLRVHQEAVSAVYLRLSESNISTLLRQCQDGAVDIDFHPHMKYSEIDISKLFKDSEPASPSTEIM